MSIVIPIVSQWDPQGLDRATADFQRAEGGWAKAGVAVEKAALPAAAALGALGAVGMKAIGAAEEAAAANAKLSQVFESMGLSRNTQEALDYADALSKQIGVDDEIIKGAQTKLATFSEVAKSTETMGRATSLAADLSAAGFGSMDSAAVMLGKAIQDPIKGLSAMSRVGVTFTKQQEKQITAMVESGREAEAQGIIMDSVAKQVGGVAEESATSSAKMGVAFGEVMESIGAGLLPVFEKLIPHLQGLAEWAQKNSTLLVILGGVVATIAAGILILAGALKALAIIKTVITLIKGMNLALLTSPWFWVIAAVILLAVIIYTQWDKIVAITKTVMGWLWGFIKPIWENLRDLAKAVFTWIVDKIKWAWDLIKTIFLNFTAIGLVIKHWDTLKRVAKVVFDFVADKIKWAWGVIKTILGLWLAQFQRVKDVIGAVFSWIVDRIADAWGTVKAIWDRVNPVDKVVDGLNRMKDTVRTVFDWVVDKIEWAWDKVSGLMDDIGGAFGPLGGLIDKIPGVGAASAGVASSSMAAGVMPVSRALVGGVPEAMAEGGQTYAVSRRGATGGVTINVNGALDPDSVGRQVKRLLETADLRQGRLRGEPKAVAW